MKQFLTICMAAAMLGSAMNADAKISREKAMQLKSEGKGYSMPIRTRDAKALKTFKQASVSGFHKMMEQKNAQKKAPARVTPLGDEIYGYLGYADDYVSQPIGLYEFEGTTASMKWADPIFESDMLNCMNVAKIDDKLVGYIIDQFWGMVFGIYYVEFDFESGEVVDFQSQDLENGEFAYLQTFAYNEKDNKFYGYGGAAGVGGLVSSSPDEPFSYSLVKEQDVDGEFCMSMCYNPADQKMYGVNSNYEFVEIDAQTGVQTKVMDLNVPDGATYITGLCYDPKSSLYYWNINYVDGSSAMATIDPAKQEVNVYAELGNGEEYMNLICGDEYGADPNRPDRPVAGEPEFYKNNLIGIVPFTMPTQTMGGEEIPADAVLTFKSYVNGEFYNQGTSKPGEVVRESFAVPESGKYTFSMTVVYNDLESKGAKVTTWVGDDVPLSPTNVKMNTREVTWEPVTESVHGGYLELSALYYEVTVNGKTQETPATSCSITLPEDADLAVYNAMVVAVCNGMRSAPAYSNNVPAGKGIPVPVEFMPNPDEFALSIQLDGNEDGKCWNLAQSTDEENPYFVYTQYTNDPTEPMDDWLFLPKVNISDVEKFYTFSFEVALRSNFYADEYVEVLLCNEADPRGVVAILVDEMSPESYLYEPVSTEFRVRQAGDYYIAVHCTSDGDQLGIAARNFAIADNNITMESPAQATDLKLTADPDRALKATVEFTMPSLTMGEVEIDPATMLTAVITTPAEQVRVKGLPGKTVTKVVETEQGWNDVIVEISNNDGFNSPSLKGTVYTGWDVPSTPENLVVEASEDMTTLTLTWDAVTTGWLSEEEPTEGVINPETVTYDIYMLVAGIFGDSWELYESGITDTTYVYDATDEQQDQVYLGVVAVNEAGDNGTLTYGGDVVGEIYELPIDEDFEGGMLYTTPWLIYKVAGSVNWGLYDNSQLFDGAPEGASMVAYADAGNISRLAIPRFSTAGLSQATMTLDILQTNMPILSVYAKVYGEEPELIHQFYKSELTEEMNSLSFDLPSKYLDKTWVALYLQVDFENDGEMLAIENLSIDGVANGVNAIASESVRIAGGKGMIKVIGLNGQDVTVASADGAIVAKAAKATDSAIFNVEKGVYVVVAGDKKAKVIVK